MRSAPPPRKFPVHLGAALAMIAALALPRLSRAASPNDTRARGREIFNSRCVFCHGEGLGHPAWQMLDIKKGKSKAEILGRSDLTPIYIKTVVRHGLVEMPPFRPSEISDPDLDALAAYVINPGGVKDAK